MNGLSSYTSKSRVLTACDELKRCIVVTYNIITGFITLGALYIYLDVFDKRILKFKNLAIFSKDEVF